MNVNVIETDINATGEAGRRGGGAEVGIIFDDSQKFGRHLFPESSAGSADFFGGLFFAAAAGLQRRHNSIKFQFLKKKGVKKIEFHHTTFVLFCLFFSRLIENFENHFGMN